MNVSASQLKWFADSGEYYGQLDDGRVVDLQTWYYGGGMSDMGSMLSKLIKKVKKSKVAKAVLGVGLALLIPGVGAALSKVAATVATSAKTLVSSGGLKALEGAVRSTAQAAGVIPTNDQVATIVNTLAADALGTSTTTTTATTATATTSSLSTAISKYEKYLPYVLIGAVALVIMKE